MVLTFFYVGRKQLDPIPSAVELRSLHKVHPFLVYTPLVAKEKCHFGMSLAKLLNLEYMQK
jgi:hypothetical protein